MGYTHYWRQLRDFTDTEWQELTRLTKLITADGVGSERVKPVLATSGPNDPITINNKVIMFNGIGEDGHETFCITKKKRAKMDYEEQEAYDKQGAFEFCKTAHKPYDKYVVAVLCALYNMKIKLDEETPPVLYIRSDGNTKDWTEGLFHAVRSTREEEMLCPIRDCLTLSYVDWLDSEKKTG
tara:strand:+ start:159 stop:704 length:546 start_codon:yes stop_codon:yes gene_type:complete